jgi:alkanesulfonate monooxygenase SsuD/methylene tetrahydromethanopterin reductase-like flavin-dependent oxidoreductase (luciferase family)
MRLMQRFGMTVPFDGPQLHEQRDRFERLERLGYTDLWTAEAMGADGLTPLTLGAVWTPSMRLGTAILPAYTRGPALLAQSVAGLASAAPGRFVLGIGSSSNVIVERWNGIPFEKPFQQTRDMVRFLKAALGGEKVTETYDTFDIKGFRLGLVPEQPVPILVAALREGMLRMAAEKATAPSSTGCRPITPPPCRASSGRKIPMPRSSPGCSSPRRRIPSRPDRWASSLQLPT